MTKNESCRGGGDDVIVVVLGYNFGGVDRVVSCVVVYSTVWALLRWRRMAFCTMRLHDA